MNSKLFQLMPELDHQEMIYVDSLVKNFDDQQMLNFANFYRSRRRDPQLILLTGLLGFVGVAGVQRFVTDQIGMGIVYFFTGGWCLIGKNVEAVLPGCRHNFWIRQSESMYNTINHSQVHIISMLMIYI